MKVCKSGVHVHVGWSARTFSEKLKGNQIKYEQSCLTFDILLSKFSSILVVSGVIKETNEKNK